MKKKGKKKKRKKEKSPKTINSKIENITLLE
jgi:hypothetical protein